jgi:spore maturation protein CgeB
MELIESRLDSGLAFFGDALDLMTERYGEQGIPEWGKDASALASARIIAQAAAQRTIGQPVDAAIVVTGLKLHWSVPITLRGLDIPTALLTTETPYDDREKKISALYNHVFTHEMRGLELFKGHPSLHYLPHAYNPERHKPGPCEPDKAADVYFVGAGFPERRELFSSLVADPAIRFELQGVLWKGDALDEKGMHLGAVPNSEAIRWYRSAAINLNHHRTTTAYLSGDHIPAGSAVSPGPRAFEIAACGGFQLCDDSRPELHAIFGDSVPTYRAGNAEDLHAAVHYWLAHPDKRERRAAEALQRVQEHSWYRRAAQILEVLYA